MKWRISGIYRHKASDTFWNPISSTQPWQTAEMPEWVFLSPVRADGTSVAENEVMTTRGMPKAQFEAEYEDTSSVMPPPRETSFI